MLVHEPGIHRVERRLPHPHALVPSEEPLESLLSVLAADGVGVLHAHVVVERHEVPVEEPVVQAVEAEAVGRVGPPPGIGVLPRPYVARHQEGRRGDPGDAAPVSEVGGHHASEQLLAVPSRRFDRDVVSGHDVLRGPLVSLRDVSPHGYVGRLDPPHRRIVIRLQSFPYLPHERGAVRGPPASGDVRGIVAAYVLQLPVHRAGPAVQQLGDLRHAGGSGGEGAGVLGDEHAEQEQGLVLRPQPSVVDHGGSWRPCRIWVPDELCEVLHQMAVLITRLRIRNVSKSHGDGNFFGRGWGSGRRPWFDSEWDDEAAGNAYGDFRSGACRFTRHGHFRVFGLEGSVARVREVRLKGTSVPFRTAMLALRNQKCRIYGDTVLVDEPKKKAVIAYEKCSIESPLRLTVARNDHRSRTRGSKKAWESG